MNVMTIKIDSVIGLCEQTTFPLIQALRACYQEHALSQIIDVYFFIYWVVAKDEDVCKFVLKKRGCLQVGLMVNIWGEY